MYLKKFITRSYTALKNWRLFNRRSHYVQNDGVIVYICNEEEEYILAIQDRYYFLDNYEGDVKEIHYIVNKDEYLIELILTEEVRIRYWNKRILSPIEEQQFSSLQELYANDFFNEYISDDDIKEQIKAVMVLIKEVIM